MNFFKDKYDMSRYEKEEGWEKYREFSAKRRAAALVLVIVAALAVFGVIYLHERDSSVLDPYLDKAGYGELHRRR